MKKIVLGFIALAMSVAFATAAVASIPDGDGISPAAPPGLIASSTETIISDTVLAGITKLTPALASVTMGTKGESPQLMAGIKGSSPQPSVLGDKFSPPHSTNIVLSVMTIGGGSGDSKTDPSWVQAQASPGGGLILAKEDSGYIRPEI
ncbi:MAG: hypothetical protein PHN60_02370 [Candidatus Gracilibacteria bacterium]|nr:hypothetical protein [Candidatus Gracilibacteria bacterium]